MGAGAVSDSKMSEDRCPNNIVAFIDVLGWQYVWENGTPAKQGKLIDLIYTFARETSGSPESKCKITTFSDNIVISHEVFDEDKFSALENVISEVLKLYTYACDKEVILRGGIMEGSLYHRPPFVAGKGLHEAVKLEKEAKYPRTVIDKELIAELAVLKLSTLPLKQDETDQSYFVDYLQYMKAYQTDTPYLQKGERSAQYISDIISKNIQAGICKDKWEWLAAYFNATLDAFTKKGISISCDKISYQL